MAIYFLREPENIAINMAIYIFTRYTENIVRKVNKYIVAYKPMKY